MSEKVKEIFEESARVKLAFLAEYHEQVVRAAHLLATALKKGRKVLFFGNGGSAADAQHLAAELVNRFLEERPALPGIALTTDTSILTSIGNDRDYTQIFARQVEALGQKGDVAVGISTSGTSPNVLEGIRMARKKEMHTLGFTGAEGKKLASLVDIAFCVPSRSTPRIQEVHITLGHALCALVEEELFGS